MKNFERSTQESKGMSNLLENWYFPISAGAFYCLNATMNRGYMLGIPIAFLIMIFVSSRMPPLREYAKRSNTVIRLLSLATSAGVCLCCEKSFVPYWRGSHKIQLLERSLPIVVDISKLTGIFGAVVASIFVYLCTVIFWNRMLEAFFEVELFTDIKWQERVVYGVLLAISIAGMIFAFSRTNAFYGADTPYDIIYTSDSPALVKGNVYLALTHGENDLRQPLFAVFAAPFAAIPYLVAQLLQLSTNEQAVLTNCIQVVMLFVANLMLTRMMKLDSLKRVCFMVLIWCTYAQMLFTMMMEQYIVAYFWLVFCMMFIVEKQQPDRIALWGAGGTLLTGMVLLPSMSKEHPTKKPRKWAADMVKYGLEFVVFMLAFCRFDIIWGLKSKIASLMKFTGKSLTMTNKIFQYTAFVHNCFFAPNAGVDSESVGHISWQLWTATGINTIGVVVLLLAVISAIWNRKKSSLLALTWVVFSVAVLLLLGWGTKENGLILYALYFGWAFLVLLFQLVEKIGNELNTRLAVPLFSVGFSIALLVINIPAISEMVKFAAEYYPA